MNERNMTKYKLAKLTGCSQSTVGYWLDGKTVPQNRTMQTVADVLGVSASYLRGETDEYGLTPTDWEWMGQAFSAERKVRRKALSDVADDYFVTADAVQEFEENGTPLSVKQLEVICSLLGTNAVYVFAAWKDKLFPPQADGDESNITLLQTIRDEQKVLLEATNHMSRAQILAMAELAKTVKGENDVN